MDAVEAFFKAGIISGKLGNIFDPKGSATRAEIAAILNRFLEVAEEGAAVEEVEPEDVEPEEAEPEEAEPEEVGSGEVGSGEE